MLERKQLLSLTHLPTNPPTRLLTRSLPSLLTHSLFLPVQVTVIAAAPVAAIDGGDRTVSVSDVLTLDGSLSFDPDAVTVTDTSTVSFQWYTQSFTAASSTRLRSRQLSERRSYDPSGSRGSRSSHDHPMVHRHQRAPRLRAPQPPDKVAQLREQPPISDTHLSVDRARSTPDRRRLAPSARALQSSAACVSAPTFASSATVSVPAGLCLGEFTFCLKVCKLSTAACDDTCVRIDTVSNEIPTVSVLPGAWAGGKHNANKRLELNGVASLSASAEPASLSLQWEVRNSETRELLPLSPATMSTMTSSGTSLALRPGVLMRGATYTFTLQATQQIGGVAQRAYATQKVVVNEAPSNGNITVSPLSGTAYETQFTATAHAWTDFDPPLFYTFKVGEQILATKTPEPTCKTIAGLSNGTKVFSVTVYDVYGAASAVTQAADTVEVQAKAIDAAVASSVVGAAQTSLMAGDLSDAAVAVTSLVTGLIDQGTSASVEAADLDRTDAFAQAAALVGQMTQPSSTGGTMSGELFGQVVQTMASVASVGAALPEASQGVVLKALIDATSQVSDYSSLGTDVLNMMASTLSSIAAEMLGSEASRRERARQLSGSEVAPRPFEIAPRQLSNSEVGAAELTTVATALEALLNASSACELVCGEEACTVSSELVNISTSLACDLGGASFAVAGGSVTFAHNFTLPTPASRRRRLDPSRVGRGVGRAAGWEQEPRRGRVLGGAAPRMTRRGLASSSSGAVQVRMVSSVNTHDATTALATSVTSVELVDPSTREPIDVSNLQAGQEVLVAIEIPQDKQALTEDPSKDHCDVGSLGYAPRQCHGLGLCVLKQCWCQLPYSGDQCELTPKCAFFDEAAGAWSSSGLDDLGHAAGYLQCRAPLLADFAGKAVRIADRSPPPAAPSLTPPTAPPPVGGAPPASSGLPMVAIAGGAGGAVVVLLLLTVAAAVCHRRRRRQKAQCRVSPGFPQPASAAWQEAHLAAKDTAGRAEAPAITPSTGATMAAAGAVESTPVVDLADGPADGADGAELEVQDEP